MKKKKKCLTSFVPFIRDGFLNLFLSFCLIRLLDFFIMKRFEVCLQILPSDRNEDIISIVSGAAGSRKQSCFLVVWQQQWHLGVRGCEPW
jgi:hypothetical protein